MIKIIKASAGSGKTYQLTYEYIKLLLGQKKEDGTYYLPSYRKEYHQHILAVTFTNMATKEMKDRIVRELSILSGKEGGKESPYIKMLCKDLEAKAEDVEKAADEALTELLFDYSNFNVSTIDSFFQIILRTFAREAEITYNYDIELNDKYAVRMGVNRFLSDVNNGVFAGGRSKHKFDAERWISEYISNEVADGRSWNIFKDVESVSNSRQYGSAESLSSFAQIVNTELFKSVSDDIKEYFEDEGEKVLDFKKIITKRQRDEREAGINAVRQLFALFAHEGMDLEFLSRNGGILWAKQILDDNERIKDADPITFAERGTKNPEKWFVAKSPQKLSEGSLIAGTNLIKDFENHVKRYLIYQEINRKIYLFALLGEISKYIFKFREENNLILLSDTNELLHRIINDDDTPFIYERVGVWLNHFLIDEFQDTSRAQWINMRPLLNNSVADGNDNLIIGDEKQCIYRFRNSDPSLLRTEVEESFTSVRLDGSKSTNWRSKAKIIKFNNTFFSIAASKLGVKEIYSNVIQQIPEKKLDEDNGFVRMFQVSKPEDFEGSGNGWFKEEVLKRLPNLIQEMRSRGYKLKDIALLVNTNNEGAEAISSILSYNQTVEPEKRLNVVSTEALMLNNSPSVRLIISTLRYLNTQDLTPSDSQESNVPIFLKKDEYRHRVLKQYDALLNKGMDAGEAMAKSFETVSKEDLDGKSFVSSIIPSALEAYNLITIAECVIKGLLSEEAIEAENAYIQEFMDIINDFSNSGGGNIYSFLKWWDQGGCRSSIKSPQGQDAIKVLTIHKSKGLEFKCVILPFCDWELGGKTGTIWIKRDDAFDSSLFEGIDIGIIPPLIPLKINKKMGIEESDLGHIINRNAQEEIVDNLNKTYVAFTRAEDELYFFIPADSSDKNDVKVSNLLDSFVADAHPDLIKELQAYGDVACGAESREDGFLIGEAGMREEEVKVESKGEKIDMPSYAVNIRPGLLKFKIPDLFVSEQRERGILMHKVLSRIRFKDDRDFALHLYRKRAALTDEEFEDMRVAITKALDDERVQWWFVRGNKVCNERGIYTPKENLRPDRFFTTPDGRTVVVDYKFGEVHSQSHIKQVHRYMSVLRDCGYDNLEGYVWYPIEGEIIPVAL